MWDNSTLQSFLTFNVIHKVQQHCGYQSNYKKVEGKPMQKKDITNNGTHKCLTRL